jgi:hypothetical protein
MIATAFSPRITVPLPEPFRQLDVEGRNDQQAMVRFDQRVCGSAERWLATQSVAPTANICERFPRGLFLKEHSDEAPTKGAMGKASTRGSIG